MKFSNLTKLVGVSALALTLSILPSVHPASAQVTDDPVPNRTLEYEDDNDFDWGWLGLIGLAGLAGLRGRKHDETVRYREPDVTTTGTRYRE
ncbi:MAG: WGxxGxxG family protein [Lyngbya sp.]|nr:WGxxGxxG family protein [Lyngbya sp.]